MNGVMEKLESKIALLLSHDNVIPEVRAEIEHVRLKIKELFALDFNTNLDSIIEDLKENISFKFIKEFSIVQFRMSQKDNSTFVEELLDLSSTYRAPNDTSFSWLMVGIRVWNII
jgi:hypothetical protein